MYLEAGWFTTSFGSALNARPKYAINGCLYQPGNPTLPCFLCAKSKIYQHAKNGLTHIGKDDLYQI